MADIEAYDFLLKRGLSRDRANLIHLLVRFRQELNVMYKQSKDDHVKDCIDGMSEIIGETIAEVYEIQGYDQ